METKTNKNLKNKIWSFLKGDINLVIIEKTLKTIPGIVG